jgi:hypothetical protein
MPRTPSQRHVHMSRAYGFLEDFPACAASFGGCSRATLEGRFKNVPHGEQQNLSMSSPIQRRIVVV